MGGEEILDVPREFGRPIDVRGAGPDSLVGENPDRLLEHELLIGEAVRRRGSAWQGFRRRIGHRGIVAAAPDRAIGPDHAAWRRVRPTLGLSLRSKGRRRGPRLQLPKDEPNGSLDPAPPAHRGRRGRALRTPPDDRPATAGTVGRHAGEPVRDLDGGREALPELRDGQSLDGVALHRLQGTTPRLTGRRAAAPLR